MQTLLLTWTGAADSFPEGWYDDAVRATVAYERPELGWNMGNRRSAEAGDRVFLLRQGEKAGVVASGYLVGGEVWPAEHWSDPGKVAYYATVAWDRVLHVDDRLPLARLQREVPEKNWTFNKASGQELRKGVPGELEDAWRRHLWSLDPVGDGDVLRGADAEGWLAVHHHDRVASLRAAVAAAGEVFGRDEVQVVASPDEHEDGGRSVAVVVTGRRDSRASLTAPRRRQWAARASRPSAGACPAIERARAFGVQA